MDIGGYEFGIGDYDWGRDVDLGDFGGFGECETGPTGGPLPDGCESLDFDGDGDVDFGDWGGFQDAFTGTP